MRYFLLSILLAISCTAFAADDVATYSLTFNSTWSSQTHPHPTGQFPSGAHMSSLIGAVHNSSVSYWRHGELASPGIESMAERGGTSTLSSEITASGNKALSIISGSGLASPGSTSISTITVNRNYPLITLVSMIAPTPDWFVGVSGLSMLDQNSAWHNSLVVTLYPYDSGSDDGPDYTSADIEPAVHQPIKLLTGIAPFSSAPIGTFTFTRTNTPPPPPPAVNVLTFTNGPTATPSPALVGQEVSFSVTVAGSVSPATSYLWDFGDNTTASGASAKHTYSIPASYVVKITATDGAVSNNSTTSILVSNIPPTTPVTPVTPTPDPLKPVTNILTFVSAPSAVPNPAIPGQEISFFATVIGRERPASSIIWDFGDSTTATGQYVKHTYNIPGIYLVKISASDSTVTAQGSLNVTVSTPSIDPMTPTSPPTSPNTPNSPSTPMGPVTPAPNGGLDTQVVQSLTINQALIRLNFLRNNYDSILIRGEFELPSEVSLNNQTILLEVGGVSAMFKLNDNGDANNGVARFTSRPARSAKVATTVRTFTAKLTQGNFAPSLGELPNGEADVRDAEKSVPIKLTVGNTTYQKTQKLSYTTQKGRLAAR